jgi:hypothetical protein
MSIWPRGLIHVATWPRGLMHVAIWPRVNRGRDHVAACLQSTWPKSTTWIRERGHMATGKGACGHMATWKIFFFLFSPKKKL